MTNGERIEQLFSSDIFWFSSGNITGVGDKSVLDWWGDEYEMSLVEAIRIIAEAYKTDDSFREATIATIEGALRECIVAANKGYTEISEVIADRIFGNE